MGNQRTRALVILGLLCLGFVLTASPTAAAPGGNGRGTGSGNNPPSVGATPELGSLMLFGTGAAGMAGYALMQLRARRRRQDKDTD